MRLALDHAAQGPQGFPDLQLAVLHAEVGELEAAFRHRDRAIESRDPALVHLAVGPQWDGLRVDAAAFARRLERMGL